MEKVEPVFIHITKPVGNFSGTFVVLDSPWDHLNQPTLPCQGNAEARGLHHPDCYCSNLPWHGFDPLQGALGSGTACPVLALARDRPHLAGWMQLLHFRGGRF